MAPGRKQPRRILRRNLPGFDARFACDHLRGEGRITNISRDGVFVRSAQLPPVGAVVRLALSGLECEVTVAGIVRWSTAQLPDHHPGKAQSGFGVHISESNQNFRQLFERVLTE